MAVFEKGLSLLGHVCINILLLLLHKSLIYQKPLLMNTLYIIFFFWKIKKYKLIFARSAENKPNYYLFLNKPTYSV